MYYYENLEGWDKFKYLWCKGAITAFFVALVCVISVFAGMISVGLIGGGIDYLFSYEINAYILFGIIIIVYAPYCLGIAMDIVGDYPPKETKIEE